MEQKERCSCTRRTRPWSAGGVTRFFLAEADKVITRWTVRAAQSGEFLGLAPTGDQVTVSSIEFDRMAGGRIDETWVGQHRCMGVAATGRGVEAMGMDAVRVADGEIAEHWGEFGAVGLLRRMGIVSLKDQA